MFENKVSVLLVVIAVVFAGLAGEVIYQHNEPLGTAITAGVLAVLLTLWATTEAIVRAIKKGR